MTANITKRKVITVPTGNPNVLFDIGEDFVSGSFWIFEVDAAGQSKVRVVEQEVGTFIKINPAPAGDTKLHVMYEVEGQSQQGNLTDYDYERMEKIAEVLSKQADQIKILNEGLLQRITKKEMLRWQDAMKVELDKLNTNVKLSSL